MDYFDILDMFSFMDGFYAVRGLTTVLTIINVLVTVVVIALIYALPCYLRMLLGRKLGMRNDWPSFVPFASDFYRVKMLGEPTWKMLFFGWFSAAIATGILFISSQFGLDGLIVGVILTAIYFVFVVVFRTKYYFALYEKFGYHKVLAFLRWTPLLSNYSSAVYVVMATARPVKTEGATHIDPPSAKAKITGVSGQYRGQTFDLSDGKEIVLGKSAELSNIIFDQFQVHVSRKHCSIRFDGQPGGAGGYIVTNFSKNGVLYNNTQKIEQNESRVLTKGTVIALGTNDNQFILN